MKDRWRSQRAYRAQVDPCLLDTPQLELNDRRRLQTSHTPSVNHQWRLWRRTNTWDASSRTNWDSLEEDCTCEGGLTFWPSINSWNPWLPRMPLPTCYNVCKHIDCIYCMFSVSYIHVREPPRCNSSILVSYCTLPVPLIVPMGVKFSKSVGKSGARGFPVFFHF